MQPPNEIMDEIILLRQYQLNDIPMIVEAVRESAAELKPWISWCQHEYTEEQARVWLESLPESWEKGISYDFAMIDSTDRSYLGGCGINHIRWIYQFANLGYWVRTDRTGQGIASRVVPLLTRYAFEHLGLKRVEIVVAVGNKASQRVAQKAGAVREGILRNRVVIGENVYDAVMHSLIPQDFDMEAR